MRCTCAILSSVVCPAVQFFFLLISHQRHDFLKKVIEHKMFVLIQINHQPDAKIFQFIILTFIYSSTCFARSPAHHQERNDCSSSLWFYHLVKPEATTAVIALLMMGGETPETCWAVNKRQDNKLENGCIWLVIYLNCHSLCFRDQLRVCRKNFGLTRQ